MASSGKKLFIRESSGLVRQMGAKHAFAKVLALIVPISLYYTLIYSPAIPAANWYIGIAVAPIMALPIFLLYLKLAEYIPRSSGEYSQFIKDNSDFNLNMHLRYGHDGGTCPLVPD